MINCYCTDLLNKNTINCIICLNSSHPSCYSKEINTKKYPFICSICKLTINNPQIKIINYSYLPISMNLNEENKREINFKNENNLLKRIFIECNSFTHKPDMVKSFTKFIEIKLNGENLEVKKNSYFDLNLAKLKNNNKIEFKINKNKISEVFKECISPLNDLKIIFYIMECKDLNHNEIYKLLVNYFLNKENIINNKEQNFEEIDYCNVIERKITFPIKLTKCNRDHKMFVSLKRIIENDFKCHFCDFKVYWSDFYFDRKFFDTLKIIYKKNFLDSKRTKSMFKKRNYHSSSKKKNKKKRKKPNRNDSKNLNKNFEGQNDIKFRSSKNIGQYNKDLNSNVKKNLHQNKNNNGSNKNLSEKSQFRNVYENRKSEKINDEKKSGNNNENKQKKFNENYNSKNFRNQSKNSKDFEKKKKADFNKYQKPKNFQDSNKLKILQETNSLNFKIPEMDDYLVEKLDNLGDKKLTKKRENSNKKDFFTNFKIDNRPNSEKKLEKKNFFSKEKSNTLEINKQKLKLKGNLFMNFNKKKDLKIANLFETKKEKMKKKIFLELKKISKKEKIMSQKFEELKKIKKDYKKIKIDFQIFFSPLKNYLDPFYFKKNNLSKNNNLVKKSFEENSFKDPIDFLYICTIYFYNKNIDNNEKKEFIWIRELSYYILKTLISQNFETVMNYSFMTLFALFFKFSNLISVDFFILSLYEILIGISIFYLGMDTQEKFSNELLLNNGNLDLIDCKDYIATAMKMYFEFFSHILEKNDLNDLFIHLLENICHFFGIFEDQKIYSLKDKILKMKE